MDNQSKKYKYDDAVIQFVNEFWQRHYHSPSMRDICQQCGVPSTSHVQSILGRLRERGLITVSSDGHGRGITPAWIAEMIEIETERRKNEQLKKV